MKQIALFLIALPLLCACVEPVEMVTFKEDFSTQTVPATTPMATPTEAPEITPIPATIPVPEGFSPREPFKFFSENGFINLVGGIYTTIIIDGIGDAYLVPETYQGEDLLEQLGKCDRKAVITNGYDAEYGLVTYKTYVYIHSGISGCGVDNATNFIRIFLEGPFRNNPDLENRPEKILELMRYEIQLKQETGVVRFKIDDLTVVRNSDWDREGNLEHHFVSGAKPGVRELYLVFCSAEKSGDTHAKIILRLTQSTDKSEP